MKNKITKKEDITICIDEICSSLLRIWTFIKKSLPWFLCVYLIIVMLISLICIASLRETVVGQLKSLAVVSIYWELINYLVFINWVAGVLFFPMVLIWGVLCYCVWLLFSPLMDLCCNLFSPDDSKWRFSGVRYHKMVDSSVRRRVKPVKYVLLVLVAIFLCFAIPPIVKSFVKIISLYIYLVIFLVPIVFAYIWFFYLMVRRSRRNTRRFDYYFFSKQVIRNKLSVIISFLVFIALLGNVFIPVLFGELAYITNLGPRLMLKNLEYEQKYQKLVEDGYTNTKNPRVVNLPSPNEMRNYMWYLLDLDDNFKPNILIKQFQQGMFFIVTIACFFQIAIPSIGNAVVYRKYRDGLKKIIWSTINSIVIVGCLHFLVEKAYFVDTSKVIGLTTLFLFVVSISLSHGAVDPLKAER